MVTFANNSATWATLYAPQSTINIANNGLMTGAVAGATVNLSNNTNVAFDSHDTTLTATAIGVNYRTAWDQCPPGYAASAPMANCP